MNYTSETPLKTCRTCGIEKPANTEYYHRDSSKQDGFRNHCRECNNKAMRDRYNEEPEATRQHNRDWRKRNPDYEKNKTPEQKSRKAETDKDWRKRNPDKVKASKKRDRLKRRAAIYTQQLRWRERNRNHINYKGREKYAENIEGERERSKRKRLNNTPEQKKKASIRSKHRRARENNAPGKFTLDDVQLLFKTQKGLCWWCGKKLADKYHVDHRIPLSRGGSNAPENLCISCPKCNLSKNSKMPWEWNGRLL